MEDDDSAYGNDDGDFEDDGAFTMLNSVPEMKRFDKVLDEIDVFKDLAYKSKDHMAMWKRNYWSLVCSRVGISVTEEEKLMKEEDMWYTCHTRFMETKETLPIESSVEFIFARNEELDFPDVINADLKLKSEMKHPPKWSGLKVEKIRCASNEEKDKYFIGNKVWDQWQATKKYIQNQLNGNWQDPDTLPSGYN